MKHLVTLALVVVMAAVVAVIGRPQLPHPTPAPPLDWRELTIEGFPAGVTEQQITARLGYRPTGYPHFTLTWDKHWLSLYKNQYGSHLRGQRLLYRGKVVSRCHSPAGPGSGPFKNFRHGSLGNYLQGSPKLGTSQEELRMSIRMLSGHCYLIVLGKMTKGHDPTMRVGAEEVINRGRTLSSRGFLDIGIC